MDFADFGIDNEWYDREGNVIDEAAALQHISDDRYRVVGFATVTDAKRPAVSFRVSTVWTGRNYGSPTYHTGLFETLVTDAADEQVSNTRHHDLAEARDEHARIVAAMASVCHEAVVTNLMEG